MRFIRRGGQLAAAGLLLPLILAPAAAPAAAGARQRQAVKISVPLGPGVPAGQWIAAEYCTVPGPHPAAIDVLVPGSTYDHSYWDWPQNPALYSYTDKTLLAGRAVLALDRLGTGGSSALPSTQVTDSADVAALHQAITWARGRGYDQVDVIGHSLGSIIAAEEASTYPADPAKLVLTGYLNDLTADLQSFETQFHPAADDPQFAGRGLDPGWITTLPGARGPAFYVNADPAVIARDEARKDIVSLTESEDAGAWSAAPPNSASPAGKITAPVLLVVGQDDWLFCQSAGAPDCAQLSALYQLERPYYSGAASLTIATVPGTGHDLALSPTASLSFAMINGWISRR